jgi:response regulator RpfG family c-di-GMP phosphodiesterase
MTSDDREAGAGAVLCVDDDAALLDLWTKALESAGFQVTAAPGGEQAVRELERSSFDAVLSDFRMPGMDGIEVLGHARALRPGAKRLMISAQKDFEMAVQAVNDVGLYRLISKPIGLRDLRATLQDAVRAARLERENGRLADELRSTNDRLERANVELEHANAALGARIASQTTGAVCAVLRTLGLWSEAHLRHSECTAQLARRIAQQMQLPEQDAENTLHGARIHDIGLIAVQRSLLLYPGPLDDDGRSEIRNHVLVGAMLVEALDFLGDACRVVSEHHEWWDGGGYPNGLAGDRIYVGARIVAVADAYVSLTHGRPYRRALDHDAALLEIKQWVGSQFDRDVVLALCSIPRDDCWRYGGGAPLDCGLPTVRPGRDAGIRLNSYVKVERTEGAAAESERLDVLLRGASGGERGEGA